MSESNTPDPALPLAGIRILDFTHAAAGPFATMLLADLGAAVIKIEKPKYGDGSRSMGRPMPDFPPRNSDYYVSLNRNKRSVVLDLADGADVEAARKLAAGADIVAQNFRPGVMERLGLGFEDLRGLSEGLVYCSISAFGDDGPWAGKPANDIIMQSVSGLMGITGERDGGPVRIGAPVSDYSAGLFALSGILAALLVRADHPEGQHVRISMLEASLNLMCNYIPSVAGFGERVPRCGRGHAQIVPYQAFECAEGEYAMVGAFTRNFWQNLCRAVGHEEWIEDPRFARNASRLDNREELIGMLDEIFRRESREHWLAVLEEADVPCSPVSELDEVVVSEPVEAVGSIVSTVEDGQEARVVRSPIRVDQWGSSPLRLAPDIGRDTVAVLGELRDEERNPVA